LLLLSEVGSESEESEAELSSLSVKVPTSDLFSDFSEGESFFFSSSEPYKPFDCFEFPES